MHATQHLATVKHDLAAVQAAVAKMEIRVSHAECEVNEAAGRLRTLKALRDRLLAEHAATVRGIQREQRQAAQSKKWRESVPR